MKRKVSIVFLMIATILGSFQFLGGDTLSLVAQENLIDYEIYPNPREISYGEGSFVMRDEINIVYDSTIDAPTKKRLSELLTSKGKTISSSNKHVEGKTNIIVGTYESKEYADNYIQEKYKVKASNFEKIDAYTFIANKGELVILGKDTDAAFYGVTTLKHILNQIDGSELRNFEINDYADTQTRGFIEGYYGIPWTNADRMSLMNFGGDFKMTSYVFAPKDDLYHTDKWRELYPEEELKNIAEMVQVGIDSKCKFVWTAHPFMGGFNEADYDNEMIKMKAKFEQLYSAGVRQFGILGDDVGGLNKQIVVNMMSELSEWGKTKGDVSDFMFCPEGYNLAWADFSELNVYDPQFPEDVQIFWTGNSVCAPIIQDTLTKFRTQNLGADLEKRRAPLFWLNWPVNDINMSRLLMGKGSLLHTDINVDDLYGVVTNPMQDAEPSKVALFAIADYAWNVADFDDDKSWKDSFKYIDADASDSLYTLAKHMSDPAPNGHGLVLEESEELSPLLNTFATKIANGESIVADGKQIILEMDEIIDACETFVSTSTNARMVEQIAPFAASLSDMANATKAYVQTAIALEESDTTAAWENFADGTLYLNGSKNHDRPTINEMIKAKPGSKRLTPFVESLRDRLAPAINEIVGEGQVSISVKTNIAPIHEGKLENIIDGNDETSVWFAAYEKANQYIELSLSKPTTVYGVKVLAGTSEKPQDTFGFAKLQYTLDGTTWKDLKDQEFGEYAVNPNISDVEVENVIALRYICTKTGSGNKWSAMREFSLKLSPEKEEAKVNSEVIRTQDAWAVYFGSEAGLFDDDDSAGVWYKVRQGAAVNPDTTMPGDFVGVKLSDEVLLGKIKILGGPSPSSNDYFKSAVLEYSSDGVTYTKIQDVINQRDIEIDLSNLDISAQYVRLRNTVVQNTWVGYRTFKVEQKKFYNGYVYTNVDSYKENDAEYKKDTAYVAPSANLTLKQGQYIGLKLDRIHEITSIIANESSGSLTLQAAANPYEWKNVSNPQETVNARYIRLLNEGSADVTFDLDQLELQSHEFSAPSITQSTMGSIASGKESDLFDKDRTTGMKYQKSQVKGDYMIVDLGQEIHLEKLKLVCHDSNKDYIRDGLVYVSLDGIAWDTPIITIGDQVANDKADDATIMQSFPDHEISYNTASASNINKKVRYVKIQISQSYAHRWTQINEIEINDGAYIPTVNDPSFTSEAKDTLDGYYSYMVDGDVSTMFVPDRKNAALTYSISENNKVNNIKIIQNRNVISNAKVEARIIGADSKQQTSWVTLGTLSQSVNDFVLSKDAILLDVRITWNDVIPNIIEMNFGSKDKVDVNTTELKALLDEVIDTTSWIQSSQDAYDSAKVIGKEVLDSKYVSQVSVNSAITLIHNAKDTKELKADISLLSNKVQSAITKQEDYTPKSWGAYQKAINDAKDALKKPEELSISKADSLLQGIVQMEAELIFNPRNMEQAKIVLEDLNAFILNIEEPTTLYSNASWQTLIDAKSKLEALIEANNTQVQMPDAFKDAADKLVEAKENLVNISALIPYIQEFDQITDPAIYTDVSFIAYRNAVDAAKTIVEGGSTNEIIPAINTIVNAKSALAYQSNVDLKQVIKDMKLLIENDYTTKSFADLNTFIIKVDAMDIDTLSNETRIAILDEGLQVKVALVNVSALKAQVSLAESYDKEKYTTSTYDNLEASVVSAKKEYVAGSNESVSKSLTNLDSAVRSLKLRVNKDELKDYYASVPTIDSSKYTVESIDQYKKALAVLEQMSKNPNDTSAEAFLKARNDYELALANLKLVELTKPSVTTLDTTNTNILYTMLLLSFVVVVVCCIGKKEEEE